MVRGWWLTESLPATSNQQPPTGNLFLPIRVHSCPLVDNLFAYTSWPMSHEQLESTLKQLERVGTLVSAEDGIDVWQFDHAGRTYRLNFYRRGRKNRAIREFRGLTLLQRSQIPSPHAVALLSGFRIKGEIGDAVVLDHLESAVRLDVFLAELQARGEVVPQRRDLALQVRTIAMHVGRAKLGHRQLGLDHFLLRGTQLYLSGGEHVRAGGLKMNDVLRLGHTAAPFASASELLRAWQTLGPGVDLPKANPVSKGLWKKATGDVLGENEHFGKISGNGWTGIFTKRADLPRAWAIASRLTTTLDDWQRAWPNLLARIESDQLEVIKRGDNGDVLGGEVILAGKPIAVIVKRPRRKYWRQSISDLLRPSRAKRTWVKTWKMLVRDVPCEWPMLLMEKRRLGYVVDSVLVFGQVEGQTMAAADLDAMEAQARDLLFRRAGRTLRRIEALGFTHMDAKSTNWIVFDGGPSAGPLPVLVDVDGVRHYRWATAGILRLLRAMKQHPQYTPQDSLALCQGYAPVAGPIIEENSNDEIRNSNECSKSE
jgi:tRNA A-37 threonylcarbamoyl transferase component Bud32